MNFTKNTDFNRNSTGLLYIWFKPVTPALVMSKGNNTTILIRKRAIEFKNLGLILYFLFLVIMIPVTNSFSLEQSFVRREICVRAYSISSYYISTFVYQLLKKTVVCLASLIVCFCFTYDYIGYPLIMAYLLVPFVIIPFATMVGSMLKGRKSTAALNILCIVALFVFPILDTITKLQKDTSAKVFKYFSYLCVVFTPFYFEKLIYYLEYLLLVKNAKSIMKNSSEILFSEDQISEIVKKNVDILLTYIGGNPINEYLLITINFLAPIICIVLSLVFLGRILKPEIRMRLSNTK